MNLIKNMRPKQILENFKDFNYLEYINTDENKPKTSLSIDFIKKFLEKNKNWDKHFVKKMKLFWKLEFLGFFIIILILTTLITIGLTTYFKFSFTKYVMDRLISSLAIALSFLFLFVYNLTFLPRIILNKITDRVENFKTFELLFGEHQFKNFDEKNGPYEFQIALLLKGQGNLMRLALNRSMDRFKNNRPNLISCMYLVTKMLIYYFEQEK